MTERSWMELVGITASVAMPLWNIPLILRIRRRRSSQDISVAWTLGVFACMLLMLPSALVSADRVFTTFGVVNTVLFGAVVAQVLRYRKG